jgi:hypothetical protein
VASVLITVRLPRGASLESAMRELDLSDDEVDTRYGLVSVDPAQDLYALRVTESAGRRLRASESSGPEVSGPWADPPIEPYGRPR